MTFEEMQNLLGQLISLECALGHYKLFDEIRKGADLQNRLSIYYDTDEADKIKDDCNQFLLKHSETMERFDRDTL